jgi:hypothetical protein
MRSEAMDDHDPPIDPPAKYRIEHRRDELASLILEFFGSMPEAFAAVTAAVRRRRKRGGGGRVVLIHQAVTPEVELARRKVRRGAAPD